MRNPDFSSDFHLFGVEWLPTGFKFYVDNELIGYMSPPPGGFWEMGGFEGENIWNLTGNGTRIAPFDHPVMSLCPKLFMLFQMGYSRSGGFSAVSFHPGRRGRWQHVSRLVYQPAFRRTT